MTEQELREIAEQLDGKKTPSGYMCRCPAHDDRENSLSVKLSDNGRILVNCFAGCDYTNVKEKLKPMIQDENVIEFRKKVTAYRYLFPDGELAFEKFRSPGKRMSYRKGQIQAVKDSGRVVPLYNAPAIAAIGDRTLVICEGEKDCDSISQLGFGDYVVTTNHSGAASWNKDDTAQVVHCNKIIICEDNDDAGRGRTKKLLAQLKRKGREIRVDRYTELPEKGDVSDWLNMPGNGRAELLARWDALECVKEEESAEKKNEAGRTDFFAMFRDILGPLKRDIFSDKLLYWNGNIWTPAVNQEDVLRSEAYERNRTTDLKYYAGAVLPHLMFLEDTTTPELIPDIPEWDGVDRITEYCSHVKVDESKGATSEAFREIFSEWLANVWRRLEDHWFRNFIFILTGPQRIGKDYWIDTLLLALGQWASDIVISPGDKDVYLQLSKNMVLKIPEFDKVTSKVEVSMLKDLVTRKDSNIRASYDRESKHRICRHSFIASCNNDDVLRDTTGNSRYAIFEVTGIEHGYERNLQLSRQLLAQGRELARNGFNASKASWAIVASYNEGHTPDDPGAEIAAAWCERCVAWLEAKPNADIMGRGWVTNAEADELMIRLAKDYGYSVRWLKHQLKRSGLAVKSGGRKGYKWVLRNAENSDELVF